MASRRGRRKVRAELRNTRPPAVAGQFYPADPNRLQADVQHLLTSSSPPADLAPKALIAPHAGYVYSGAVAAAAFAALQSVAASIKRVVLIGPAHYIAVSGVAVPTVERFKTPLGQVAVDLQAIDRIADLPCVLRSDAAHAPEHALEVELPRPLFRHLRWCRLSLAKRRRRTSPQCSADCGEPTRR
jgi:MEMO1 family protein